MTNFTPAQLEAWAGLGPWSWSEETICRQIYHFLGPGVLVTTETDGTPWGDTIDQTNAALIAAAPDLARLVLEKEKEIARLRAQIKDIKECWDWWQEDTYDRCGSVVDDAIRQAMKETSDE